MPTSPSYPGPSFLGIGAARSGTSWLYTQLRTHPQLWLPPIKELHYWDIQRRGARQHYPLRDANWWALRAYFEGINYRTLVRGVLVGRIPLGWAMRYACALSTDRWYQSLFPRDRICGEITPGYMLLPPPVIEQIRTMNPDMKAILLIRNPVSRAWSNVCHSLGKRVESASVERLEQLLRLPRYIARGNYVGTIKNWRTVLGEDRLFIGFFDDLGSQPRELLRQILQFLQVDSSDDRLPQKIEREVNAAKGQRSMPPELVAKISALYLDELRDLERMLGGHVSKWLAKAEEAAASSPRA